MQQGRISTIRFNEWICVCAQYEKAIARIGRQVYQGYTRGLLTDYAAIELCKEISQAFADSKRIRSDLEEELERDALRGLSVEEAKKAEEVLELTSSQKMVRNVKLRVTKLMGRAAVNRSLQSYRDRVRELSRELGLRAVAVYEKEPLLKIEGHKRLVQLANKLNEDSDKKWQEITAGKTDQGGGLNISFHTMLISFVASFANFSRGTALGKMLLKMMKYDPKEEEKKLTKQFESNSGKTGDVLAKTLEAQMAEIEEPDLDIGREMATMEREYKETPKEWGLPSTEAWVPDTSDTWAPDVAVEPPKAASPPAESKAAPAAKPPAGEGPKPQVLRQRKPEAIKGAEAWTVGDKSPDHERWAPPANASSPAQPASPPEDDWAADASADHFDAPPGPRLGSPPTKPSTLARPGGQASPPGDDWAADSSAAHFEAPPGPRLGNPPTKPSTLARPTGEAPLPVTPPAATPVQRPAKPTALGHSAPPSPAAARPIDLPPAPPSPPAPTGAPPLPPLPAMPTRPVRAASPPVTPPAPPSKASPPPLTPAAPADAEGDGLLKLVRPDDGDDLLPAFLRDRTEDEAEPSGFIPDLPDSVDSGLKIVPFGATPNRRPPDEDSTSFIPQMPD